MFDLYATPTRTDVENYLRSIHGLLNGGGRYAPLVQCGRFSAATASGAPTGPLDRDAVRWSLSGAVMAMCQSHPRRWTLEEMLCRAIVEAAGIPPYFDCGPLTTLQVWEANGTAGRSHDEIMSVLLAALKAHEAAEQQPAA